MSRRYTVILEWDPDGPGTVVSVPELPGCFAQAETVPVSLAPAREAISGHIAALIEIGEPVPVEETPALLTLVEVNDVALAGD